MATKADRYEGIDGLKAYAIIGIALMHATAVLKELLDKRDAIRKDEILSAIVKSGRSYEEIMNFLNVEETKE